MSFGIFLLLPPIPSFPFQSTSICDIIYDVIDRRLCARWLKFLYSNFQLIPWLKRIAGLECAAQMTLRFKVRASFNFDERQKKLRCSKNSDVTSNLIKLLNTCDHAAITRRQRDPTYRTDYRFPRIIPRLSCHPEQIRPPRAQASNATFLKESHAMQSGLQFWIFSRKHYKNTNPPDNYLRKFLK